MQAPEQPDQHRLLPAEVVDGDLAFPGDRVEHEVGRHFARLQWADIERSDI